MQSSRQKKRRSQFKQKVFERKEKKETDSSTAIKKKKPVGGKQIKKNDTSTVAVKEEGDDSSTDSEQEKFSKREIESNWGRYESAQRDEAERLEKLALCDGSESEIEEEHYYVSSDTGTPLDLNSLSKSPTELIDFKYVCYDSDSDQKQQTNKQSDNNLDSELQALLDDIAATPTIVTPSSTTSTNTIPLITTSNDSTQLISTDSAQLISNDSTQLISNDSAQLISNDSAQLISTDSAQLISNDSTQLISNDPTTDSDNLDDILDKLLD